MPSEKVHGIIDKLCKANEFSQSKVTGLLVEEALRSRGELDESFKEKDIRKINFMTDSFDESFSQNIKLPNNNDIYTVNKVSFFDDIKMMQEFIEFKYFKKVMNQNKHFFE